jgi:hypothetical protein
LISFLGPKVEKVNPLGQRESGLVEERPCSDTNFVDPETGVHTQAIESYWAKAKQKFKTMKGVSADALPTYLDGRMWRVGLSG